MNFWNKIIYGLFVPVLVLANTLIWVVSPENQTFNYAFSLFNLSLVVIGVVIHFQEIRVKIKSSSFRYLMSLGINVFLVFSILALLNHLSYKNPLEMDVTKDRTNSLAEQSKKVLEMVKSPLTIELFARREEWDPMLRLIQLYRVENKLIQIQAYDTEVRLDLVKRYDIKQNGTVRISYKEKSETSLLVDELSLTNSLLKILKEEVKTIYFLQGHGELKCSDPSGEGMSYLCQKLRNENYLLKDLNLLENPKLPTDISAIVMAGPQTDLLQQEIELLEKILKEGKSLFAALSPDLKKPLDKNLIRLLNQYGFKVDNFFVIDRLSTIEGSQATQPIVTKYEQHPVVVGFQHRTIFPLTLAIRPMGETLIQPIAMTSDFPGSWAESNLSDLAQGKAKFDEKSDIMGPISVLALRERELNQAESQRLAVVGTKYFLANSFQSQSGNGILFSNIINWLTNDDNIISFNRPVRDEQPVILSSQHLQVIFIISILFVPLVFMCVAIFIYRKRKYE